MKKKISKILGVGLALSLLTNLLLVATPVSADVDEVYVWLDEEVISVTGEYHITFRIYETLDQGETITIRFPEDTEVDNAAVADNGGIMYTAGFFSLPVLPLRSQLLPMWITKLL